jgi:hypothetical protein
MFKMRKSVGRNYFDNRKEMDTYTALKRFQKANICHLVTYLIYIMLSQAMKILDKCNKYKMWGFHGCD